MGATPGIVVRFVCFSSFPRSTRTGSREHAPLVYAADSPYYFIYLINRCARRSRLELLLSLQEREWKVSSGVFCNRCVCLLAVVVAVICLLDGAGGDVKMCESESKDGFDELDDLPRKPFIRVSDKTLKNGFIAKLYILKYNFVSTCYSQLRKMIGIT